MRSRVRSLRHNTFHMAVLRAVRPCPAGRSAVVETACPLDCPDACSLAVTVQRGRIVNIDGSRKNPVTHGFICAKVRKFGERVLRRRTGSCIRRSASARRVTGKFKRVTLGRCPRARRRSIPPREGGIGRRLDSAVLVRRLERSADAGQPRRPAVAAVRRVAAGAHGVRGADRRGESGALRQDAVGDLPGLSRGGADRALGRQPVGLRHSSRAVRARGAEARRHARRRRSADDGARAVGGPASRR